MIIRRCNSSTEISSSHHNILKSLIKHEPNYGFCPVSFQPMRHPMLASDGHHYELSSLLNIIKHFQAISPITRKYLTHATYDLELKEILDQYCDKHHISQHEEYNKKAALRELSTYFHPLLPLTKVSTACSSIFAFSLCTSFVMAPLAIIENDSSSIELPATFSWFNVYIVLATMATTLLADNCIRKCSNNQLNLASGSWKVVKYFLNFATNDNINLNPEERQRPIP